MKYTPQDFKSNQEVKWCPGCGNHAILSSVVKALPEVAETLGIDFSRFALVSGIGCSSRFPYYVNIYGFHSIHGRATAISTGVKCANPEMSVWQVTGDGDALAIGGNHFIHAVRRNVDINIMLFNNQIYGLTKGQYSPTSPFGTITKTSPFGTIEQPFVPGELVLGARGKFFARSLDVEMELTKECLVASAKHKGTGVTEIMQNCVIYNDKWYDYFASKENRADHTIVLRHGEPMIFGKNRDKGLVLDGFSLKVVKLGENGITEKDLLVHDVHESNSAIHSMLVSMKAPDMPVALGVIRDVDGDTYDNLMQDQVLDIQKQSSIKSVDDLLNSGDTWIVK